jgi:hypothetical protein
LDVKLAATTWRQRSIDHYQERRNRRTTGGLL